MLNWPWRKLFATAVVNVSAKKKEPRQKILKITKIRNSKAFFQKVDRDKSIPANSLPLKFRTLQIPAHLNPDGTPKYVSPIKVKLDDTENTVLPRVKILMQEAFSTESLPNIHFKTNELEEVAKEVVPAEDNHVQLLSKIASPHFYSASQRQKALGRLIQEKFGLHPTDTGSPEVQCALWTAQLFHLQHDHVERDGHIQDKQTKVQMTTITYKRMHMLKYLRGIDLGRYHRLLDALDLPHNHIETFENPYKFKYRHVTRPYKPEAPIIRKDRLHPQWIDPDGNKSNQPSNKNKAKDVSKPDWLKKIQEKKKSSKDNSVKKKTKKETKKPVKAKKDDDLGDPAPLKTRKTQSPLKNDQPIGDKQPVPAAASK